MAKSILAFDGPFDDRKSLKFVERSQREHHFGRPEPYRKGQNFRVMYEKGARDPYAVYRHSAWDRYLLRRSASDARLSGDDCYAFTMVESGTKKIRQANHELIVEAGQSALLPMNYGYIIEHIPSHDGLYKSKYVYLSDIDRNPSLSLLRKLKLTDLSADETQAANSILDLLLDNGDLLQRHTCRNLIKELTHLILPDYLHHGLHVVGYDRHKQICAAVDLFISEHYSDPSLSGEIIAAALRISKRTLFYSLHKCIHVKEVRY